MRISDPTRHDRTRDAATGSASGGGRGPASVGDIRVEVRGTAPVAASGRYGSPGRLFSLWFSAQVSPSTFFVGALGTAAFVGLGWWAGVVAIVGGNILGSLTVAALGVLGARTGAPQLQQSRLAFGRGVHLPAGLTWVTQIGFEALAAIFGAEALQVLFGIDYAVGLLITFLVMAVLSVTGYEAIHLFEKIMLPVLGVLFVILSVQAFRAHPVIHATVHGPQLVGGFILMLALAVGYAVSWGPVAADYSRYLPENTSARRVWWASFAGLVIGMSWIEILGFAVSALAHGGFASMRDVFRVSGGGAMGIVAMAAMFLGTVAILTVEDYSGGLAAQAAGVRLPRPVVTAISAAVAFAVALWLNTGSLGTKFENVLLLISYWIPPWTAVVLLDWRRHSRRLDPQHRDGILSGSFSSLTVAAREWGALVALGAGFFACIPFSNTALGDSLAQAVPSAAWYFGGFSRDVALGGDLAFYVGFAVAAVVYVVWQTIVGRRGRSDRREA